MANKGNDWSSFMQTKSVQVTMYGLCVFFCLFYSVDGILELMSPERSANMIALMGAPGYYAMTIIRCVVLLITGVLFARVAYKVWQKPDDE